MVHKRTRGIGVKGHKKFEKVMREFKRGTLKTRGHRVTSRKQALAIAFSEARRVSKSKRRR